MTCDHFAYQGNMDPALLVALDTWGLGVPAIEYQSLGYAMLPLVRGGKKPHRMLPLDPGGVHNASLDHEQAKQWWWQDPAANIGVATGSKSRLAVIDLDVKGEHNGVDAFLEFVQANKLDLPRGPFVRTPSGGRHLWFRTYDFPHLPERPGILPGVDVKADGGLVVVPPSMKLMQPARGHGDPAEAGEVPIPYEWSGGCPCEVPAAPDWLRPWLESMPASDASQAEGNGEGSPDPDGLLEEGVPAGERNRTFYRLACALYRKHGVHADASVRVMEEIRKIYDSPKTDRTGFTWHEVLVCIQSARKFITWQMEVVDPRRQAQGMQLMAEAEPWLGKFR